MSDTGIAAFDSTIQTTNIWLNDVLDRMDWQDKFRAYHALRAVATLRRTSLSCVSKRQNLCLHDNSPTRKSDEPHLLAIGWTPLGILAPFSPAS